MRFAAFLSKITDIYIEFEAQTKQNPSSSEFKSWLSHLLNAANYLIIFKVHMVTKDKNDSKCKMPRTHQMKQCFLFSLLWLRKITFLKYITIKVLVFFFFEEKPE